MKELEKPTITLTRSPRPQWMSAMSLRLIDMIVEHCCQADHNRNVAHTLTKAVRKSLTVDTFRRAEAVAEEIG